MPCLEELVLVRPNKPHKFAVMYPPKSLHFSRHPCQEISTKNQGRGVERDSPSTL